MERAVHSAVVLAITVATLAMYAVSMRANYLYGHSIGQSAETKFAIAWANVAADVWKGFGLIVVSALWREKSRHAATIIGSTWLMCLCFSVSSAIGIYVTERSGLIATREAHVESMKTIEAELARVDAALNMLRGSESPQQVRAAVSALFARPVVIDGRVRGTVASVSANCTKIEMRTADMCARIAELNRRLADAFEHERLEKRAEELRATIMTLRERGGRGAADPVGEFWGWLSRGAVTAHAASFALSLGFALMIEMVSAFGPLGIASYSQIMPVATRRDVTRPFAQGGASSRHAATSIAVGDEPRFGEVIQYIAARTQPSRSTAGIDQHELFADYQAWCRPRTGMTVTQFFRCMDRVCASPEVDGKVRKQRDRFFGIELHQATGDMTDAP